MTYFDYSATSNVNQEVLKEFISDSKKDYLDYDLDSLSNDLNKILQSDFLVNFTSGSTEANNWAIKGILKKYQTGHILTTELEHSSLNEVFNYYKNKGFIIETIKIENGLLSLEDFKNKIKEDTILVSVCSVNSETGLINPLTEIAKILKDYPKVVFHSDMTQSMGKIDIPLNDIDLISFSAHKFYGLKGVGVLLQNKKLKLEPLFYGQRTFNLPLCRSLVKALSLALEDLDQKYTHIKKLNLELRDFLKNYPEVFINSPLHNSLSSILNISIPFVKPETFLHALEQYRIYISTQSACSLTNSYSKAVMALTNNRQRASSSLRISISYLTDETDLENFKRAFAACYKELQLNSKKI